MGRHGKCDFSQFEKFEKQFEKLSEEKTQEMCIACVKELAVRMLAKVIKRTPVGQYPKSSGKQGGTLRRGWTADEITVQRSGGDYTIEIKNPVEYASYVEYGHRTTNHTGWVNGKYMMTISAQEVQDKASAILERKLEKLFREAFND